MCIRSPCTTVTYESHNWSCFKERYVITLNKKIFICVLRFIPNETPLERLLSSGCCLTRRFGDFAERKSFICAYYFNYDCSSHMLLKNFSDDKLNILYDELLISFLDSFWFQQVDATFFCTLYQTISSSLDTQFQTIQSDSDLHWLTNKNLGAFRMNLDLICPQLQSYYEDPHQKRLRNKRSKQIPMIRKTCSNNSYPASLTPPKTVL